MAPLSYLTARSDGNDVVPSGANTGSGDVTLGISGLVIVLAVISVALRFYTRIFTRVGLGWDDWLIFSAVTFTLATAVLLLWGNSVDPNGTWVSENTNPDYVFTPQDIFYLKLAFACSILYFLIAATTKLGILCMYNRIFHVSRAFRAQLWVASALVVAWWFACNLTAFLNCRPLEWSWLNSLADPRYCIDYNLFWMVAGACEIVLDALILTLPISVLLRMHLTLRQKLTVGGIFLLGGFVIITGLVKVVLGYPPGRRVPSYHNTEVWTEVHTAMAMVCACLPIFGPLVRKLKGSALGRCISARRSPRPGLPGVPASPQIKTEPQPPLSWSKIYLPSWHSTSSGTEDSSDEGRGFAAGVTVRCPSPSGQEVGVTCGAVQPLEAVHTRSSSTHSDTRPLMTGPRDWRLTIHQGRGTTDPELMPGIRQEMLQRGFAV